MSAVKIQKISYGGWDNCVRLSNGVIELVVTADVGPRIISCGFIGKANMLGEIKSDLGRTGGDDWRIYGGHRLWHSPEHPVRTYEPDNGPVKWEETENGIRTIQDTEPRTLMQKKMEIRLSEDGPDAGITHKLHNTGLWPVTLSVWAITVMAEGGVELIPLNIRDTGLLPNSTVSLWPYTKLNDARLQAGDRFIRLRQDPAAEHLFKTGLPNESGWAAYFNEGGLFIKMFRHQSDKQYPDFGASYETYTNDSMLEMETLSPLETIDGGQEAVHREHWHLENGIGGPPADDESLSALMGPIIEKTKSAWLEGWIRHASRGGKISCGVLRKIAEETGSSYREAGDATNRLKIKIHECGLGCF